MTIVDDGLPDPAVVVLVGPSGAGKSTWANARYARNEVLASDGLRAVVGSGEHDLEATKDAFALLDAILAARIRRRLTTVVDSLGLEPIRRRGYLAAARSAGLPAVAVVFGIDADECRRRNRARDRPIPAANLAAQLRRMTDVQREIAEEGWDVVLRPSSSTSRLVTPEPVVEPRRPGPEPGLRFILQISRFPWGDDPAAWLSSVALTAAQAGFAGIALMDHLIQIPQVGRAWDPIPQPWVTLGLLAGLPVRLRLGTLVSPVTFHAAGVLAKTVATLDALTGGRAFCGLGVGWWAREHAAFDVPFPPATQRLELLARCIETMRALWRPGTKPYVGDRVTLPETTCYPRPVGEIPIIVGGTGPRVLRIAGQLADGCNVPSDPAVVDRAVAAMDGGEVTVLDVPLIGRDRGEVATLVERLRGRTPAASFARRHHAGTLAAHITRMAHLQQQGVHTVFLALPDLAGTDQVEQVTPLVAAFR
jgi:alkanesulfonate monooxygenase SsuD/methylene tetrahydromethanopterin reductase-like flavin-dependent oxidoreductase (luciferase family)/predicted kinase